MSKANYRGEQRVKPFGAEGLEACRVIVAKRQYAKVNEVMVDAYSASAIVAVCDQIGDENRAKLLAFPVARVADLCFKVLRGN